MLTIDQVPAAIRGTPPGWAGPEHVYAWGPFVVEWRRYRHLRELGLRLAPSPADGPKWAMYGSEASERTHLFEVLAPPAVNGDEMTLHTNSGVLLFRPVRESDASWIHPPDGLGDFVERVRAGLDW
jgi:hypothetical protein